MLLSAFPSISQQDKSKAKNALCISVDLYHSCFEFYTMDNWDKSTVKHTTTSYKSRLYSDEFMDELTKAVTSFVSGNPAVKESFVALSLPDNAVSMNTVNIPNMNRRRTEDAMDATVSGLYKNSDELTINRFLSAQSKQMTTYSLTVINNKLLKSVTDAVVAGGVTPDCTTFVSNSTANAVNALCPKLKNSSYLLLDIKHHYSRFAFVAKGRTTGYYALPFGYSILNKGKLFPEDMLFDHSVAELAVLNAREKAKAKQLTIMRDENVTEDSDEDEKLDAMFGEDENATADPTANAGAVQNIKSLPKKVPRKLPKFMQRPLPHDNEGYGYENFRVFVKWALNLIQSNDKLTHQGAPEKVYVNMPKELDYLYDMVNEEVKENGIEFSPLDTRNDRKNIAEHLELFGGLYAGQYNKTNNF